MILFFKYRFLGYVQVIVQLHGVVLLKPSALSQAAQNERELITLENVTLHKEVSRICGLASLL